MTNNENYLVSPISILQPLKLLRGLLKGGVLFCSSDCKIKLLSLKNLMEVWDK